MSDPALGTPPASVQPHKPTLLLLLLVVALPSLGTAAISFWLGHSPPLVNLDLLVAYCVIVLLARQWPALSLPAGVTLVAVICAVSVLRGMGLVYITDPALVIDYLGFIRYWPWAAFIKGLAAAVVVLGAFYWFLSRTQRSRARLAPALWILLFTQAADAVSGGSRFGSGLFTLNVNISTSSAYQLFAMAWQWSHTPAFRVVKSMPDSMAVELSAARQLPARIVSVSVESWGFFVRAEWNELVLHQLRQRLGARYSVELSRRAFAGGTLSGELRELCGVATQGVPSVSQLTGELAQRCLPMQLARKGYSTWAGHANVGEFYRRDALYPAMGFQKAQFSRDFGRLESDLCPGAVFSGPCDRQVLKGAVDYVASQHTGFAHVMTLSTHFPLRARTPSDFTCPSSLWPADTDLCLYVHRFSDALDEIASVLTSSATSPDLIYLYGDHAPPFASASLRAAFDPSHVPVLVLRRVALSTSLP